MIPLMVRRVSTDLQDGFASQPCCARPAGSSCWPALMGVARLVFPHGWCFGVGRPGGGEGLRQQCSSTLLRQEPGWVQDAGSAMSSAAPPSDVEERAAAAGVLPFSASPTPAWGLCAHPAGDLADDPLLTLAAVGALSGHVDGRAPVRGPDDAAANGGSRESVAHLSDLDSGGISFWNQRPSRSTGQETTSRKPSPSAIATTAIRGPLPGPHPQHPFRCWKGNFHHQACCCLLACRQAPARERPAEHRPIWLALILFVERFVLPTALLGSTLKQPSRPAG